MEMEELSTTLLFVWTSDVVLEGVLDALLVNPNY